MNTDDPQKPNRPKDSDAPGESASAPKKSNPSQFERETQGGGNLGKKVLKWWPSWLPRSHGGFAIFLILALIVGYWVPFSAPEAPKMPKYPIKDDNRLSGLATDQEKKKANKEHEEALAEFKVAEEEYNEANKIYQEDMEEWTEEGMKSRYDWISLGRNTAKWVAISWFVYCVLVMCVSPLVKAIPKQFGPDFAMVLTPVALLAVFFAAASVLMEWIPDPMPTLDSRAIGDQTIWDVMGQFIVHTTHPVCGAIIKIKEFALEKWLVPGILVVVTACIGWKGILEHRSKGQ